MYPYSDNTCNRKWYIAVGDRGEGRAPEPLRSGSGSVIWFDSADEAQAHIAGQADPPGVEIVELGEVKVETPPAVKAKESRKRGAAA
jgi:hypothetical protein